MPTLNELMSSAILKGLDDGSKQAFAGPESLGKRLQSENEAKLKQLLLGKQIEQAKALHAANPEASVNVEGVSIGARDPLRDLLRRRELAQPVLTPGQEAADKAFGKEYSDYIAGGGRAGVEKNLEQLQTAKEGLKDSGTVDRLGGYLPQGVREFITPGAVAREDAVKNAIQSTLRQTLGSQFTAEEGKALMDRAYNPRLSAQENMKRIEAIAKELRKKADQKEASARLFEKTGSLKGLGAALQAPVEQDPAAAAREARIRELEAKARR